ncbi:MAG: chemotaxis protein CheA [Pseudomonadota bacterium]
MSLNADPELLQDFLIEAGELLDGLDEQLIELERTPDDRALLNAVFRGFHTIKGGAGFLELHPLVEVCHRAEDVFNLLRNGERGVDAQLMDVMLRVLDTLKSMFVALREGDMPDHADAGLLRDLEALMSPAAPAVMADAISPEAIEPAEIVVEPETEMAQATPAEAGNEASQADLIGEDEFEQLLDSMYGQGQGPSTAAAGGMASAPSSGTAKADGAAGDLITEDEFEKLLDSLYGEGKGPSAKDAPAPSAQTSAAASDLITEGEFDKLLDSLYGEGKGPSALGAATPPALAATPSAKAVPSSEPVRSDSPKAPPAEKPESTVRVDTERLDAIMNLVGELVLVRNRLNTLKAGFKDEGAAQAIASLDTVTSDLQAAVMKTRMQPIKKVFGRFPRVVRDVARMLGKQVELVLEGEETDLDKNLVEALADPLVHLVRNAVDHGIEMPDARVAQGKPRVGTVVLSASQEGDHILLTIRDDGAGMDPDKLRRKAVEKGLLEPEAAVRLSPRECFDLIFMPGFSTKEQISDISGRGVGMDVVKTSIVKLSGSISIDSSPGQGMLISIKVPLTLAILPTLMVVVNERKYAMPLGNVSEIFEMEGKSTNIVDGQRTITVRNRALPLFDLRQWMAIPGEAVRQDESEAQIVMLQVGAQTVGLIVDRVLGQEEVVIKPLGDLLHGLPGFAGATITGDGNIALIFDLAGLLKKYGHRRGERLVA